MFSASAASGLQRLGAGCLMYGEHSTGVSAGNAHFPWETARIQEAKNICVMRLQVYSRM